MVSTSIKTCPTCGKDFKVFFGKKNSHRKYCSRKCYVASLTPRKKKKEDIVITQKVRTCTCCGKRLSIYNKKTKCFSCQD